jgi:hypothetical protein
MLSFHAVPHPEYGVIYVKDVPSSTSRIIPELWTEENDDE